MRSLIFLPLLLCFVSSAAMACHPIQREVLAETPDRVKANFDGVQLVFTAYLIDQRWLTVDVPPGSDSSTGVESASFRVERSFKGKLKPGEIFKIDFGMYLCDPGLMEGRWIPFVPPGSRRAIEYPKHWLIYYTPPATSGPRPQLPPFHILSPLTRPVRWARYDIDVLKKFSDRWSGDL